MLRTFLIELPSRVARLFWRTLAFHDRKMRPLFLAADAVVMAPTRGTLWLVNRWRRWLGLPALGD